VVLGLGWVVYWNVGFGGVCVFCVGWNCGMSVDVAVSWFQRDGRVSGRCLVVF